MKRYWEKFYKKNYNLNSIKRSSPFSKFVLKKIINYRSEMITEINQENKKLLEQFPPDLIYIYSARSAESFIGLAKNYNLIPLMTRSTIMCISEKVAKIFKSLGWKKIEIFNPGDEMAKL